MKLSYNEFLAVVYADLFSFSLTRAEAKLWAITTDNEGKQPKGDKRVVLKNGHLTLIGREKLSQWRKERAAISQKKFLLAQTVALALGRLPSVLAIFLTGSVAVGNAKEEADIDLMIVTVPHTVWLTRLIVVVILKLAKLYRSDVVTKNKFCTNIYLDSNHLSIGQKNIYTAHEVLQAKCLIDKRSINKQWLKVNAWTKVFLPRKYQQLWLLAKRAKPLSTYRASFWTIAGLPFELLTFIAQRWYMNSKITNERFALGYAFFHPTDLSLVVMQRFASRLKTAR